MATAAALLVPVVECPLCKQIRRFTNIFQCKNGHNICAVCKVSIHACPKCGIEYDIPPKRNKTAEDLIATGDFVFTCKHKGCDYRALRSKLERHEEVCKNRKASIIPCPKKCGVNLEEHELQAHITSSHAPCEFYPECDWVSNRYGEAMLHSQECQFRPVACPHAGCNQAIQENALAEHLVGWHSVPRVQVPDGHISKKVYFQSDVGKSTTWPLALFDYDLRTFIPCLERNPDDNLFYAWAFIIGNKKEAQNYR